MITLHDVPRVPGLRFSAHPAGPLIGCHRWLARQRWTETLLDEPAVAPLCDEAKRSADLNSL